MTVSIAIRYPKCIDTGRVGNRKQWWANFTATIRQQRFGLGLDFTTEQWIQHRTDFLADYNAEYDGEYVHFDSAQDATYFMLRWS